MKIIIRLKGDSVWSSEQGGRWLFGRSEGCDVQLADDPYCPREAGHLTISDDDVFFEVNPHATNVEIDGRSGLGKVQLRHNSMLQLGETQLQFDISHGEANQAPPQPSSPKTTVLGKTKRASVSEEPPHGIVLVVEQELTIGKGGGAGRAHLPHPTVSRQHATVQLRNGKLAIRDLDSTNGTFVNGQRTRGTVGLDEGDRVNIGTYNFRVTGNSLAQEVHEGKTLIELQDLCVDVRDRGGDGMLRILDTVSINIQKSSLVCIVGSSGSGKSTLMNVMAARNTPSYGQVHMLGLDLFNNFSTLKHGIAYVPQDNILHESLTLRQALSYAVELRLPSDISAKDRSIIVDQAAASVDLEERLDMRIQDLSGGQKKRASLACETLSSPDLLFLDEVTSGLDEATDREIMSLMRRRADEGMTVVCVTHTLANVEAYCDQIIFMGRGGVLAFVGPPAEAIQFFGVERLGDVFDKLDSHGPEYWRAKSLDKASSQRSPSAHKVAALDTAPAKRPSILRQFGVLVRRNTRLTLSDNRNLVFALIQSTMIGVMLGYAYSNFGDESQEIASRIALLMALGTAALWLGTTTASTNIVGEAIIFQRERDVNVSTVAFVLSKFLVSGIFTMLQLTLVFILARALAQEIPGDDLMQYGFLMAGSLIGVSMGLGISAFSATQAQANTIVPLALIPQLILAGVLVPALPDAGVLFSKISISAFWMTEGMTDVYIQTTDPFPETFNAATGQLEPLEAEQLKYAVVMLALHLGGTLSAAVFVAVQRFSKRA